MTSAPTACCKIHHLLSSFFELTSHSNHQHQIETMKLLTALLLSTLAASSTARPRQRKAEGEEHSCACEALEFNFDIDCANTSAMLDAMTVLKTSGCAQDCSSELCERNYLIVQSHHDYCPEAGIPEEVEG